MRILLTSSRLPFALALIRRLAEAGHEVHAADAYAVAPGNHSRYLSGHLVTAPPRPETERFVNDVKDYVTAHGIERVVPAFEEAFYLATRYDRLQQVTDLYTAPFATLARLHDKATFSELARKLELRLPATTVATRLEELRAATEHYGSYFARAAFSRGGIALLTNTGPLAGHTDVDDCRPTPEQPWLVQNFVGGPMQCTYSTLREGTVLTHLCYRAPRQWEHSTGIAFETVGSTSPSSARCSPSRRRRGRSRSPTCSTSAAPIAAGTTICRCSTTCSPSAITPASTSATDGPCSRRWPTTSPGTASRSPA